MLEAASKETVKVENIAVPILETLQTKFQIKRADIEPKVYTRLTDNWVELTVRFLCEDHGMRGLKSRMSDERIDRFDEVSIGIASSTYDIVGFPTLQAAPVMKNALLTKPRKKFVK